MIRKLRSLKDRPTINISDFTESYVMAEDLVHSIALYLFQYTMHIALGIYGRIGSKIAMDVKICGYYSLLCNMI